MNFYFLLLPLIPLLGLLLSVPEVHYISSQQITGENLINKSVSVKITSHSDGEKIPVGKITISGISNDDPERNCIVYIDWNDKKPFQQVRAAGPGGIDDFSEWFFTYDSDYYTIIEGNNDLTSKITCTDIPGPAGTKWYSVNLIGISETNITSSNQKTNITNSLDEPSHIITPGFTTNLENPTLTDNIQNSKSNLVDETSQKIIPGSMSTFEDQQKSSSLQSGLNASSMSIVSSKKLQGNDGQNKTNFLPKFNTSNESVDLVLTNNTNEVKNKVKDSEILMNDSNITQPTFFENNNQSDNTLLASKSIQNNSNSDNDINPVISEDITVFVTLPERIIINTNYSSELLVLNNNSFPISNAILSGEIYNIADHSYKITFLGKTDSNGTYNFPLKISNLFPTGEYNLKLLITKLGISDATFFTKFNVLKNFSSNGLERSVMGNLIYEPEKFEKNNNISKLSQSTMSQDASKDKTVSLNNSTSSSISPFELNEYPSMEQPPSVSEPKQQDNLGPTFNLPKLELP